MYPIINLLGREIGTYALVSIIGFIITCIFSTKKAKSLGITPEDMVEYFIVAGCGIIIGGHLLYGIVNIKLTVNAFESIIKTLSFQNFANLFTVAFGGSVFYGGLFVSAISLRLFLKYKKISKKDIVFGVYSLSIPLFHTFGRIGCFFGGCCYGIESKFGFSSKFNPIVPEVCGIIRFPVSLLEASANLLIFFILLLKFERIKDKNSVFYYYGIMYSFARFNIEFLRGDKVRGMLYFLSTSQWISIGFFIYCLCRLLYKNKHVERPA